jgi:hypothetical protein
MYIRHFTWYMIFGGHMQTIIVFGGGSRTLIYLLKIPGTQYFVVTLLKLG